jgi:hypothetical protein
VDLIAYGQFGLQKVHWRYTTSWKPPLSSPLGEKRVRGRSLVVSSEGVDSSPLDWRSAPEACEIGGLGTLSAVPLLTGRPEWARGLAVPATGDDSNRSVTYSGRGRG